MTTTSTTSPDELTAAVAEEIRAQMGRKRCTGAELAKRLGVSAAWVSYRINGGVSPSVHDLARIAEALGVKVADLLPLPRARGTNEKPSPSPALVRHSAPGPRNRSDSRGPGSGRPARTGRPISGVRGPLSKNTITQ